MIPKLTVNATLTPAGGGGQIVFEEVTEDLVARLSPFVQGLPGTPGAAANSYTHVQSAPAVVWTVDHNLGFWPEISVYDDNGEEIEGVAVNPTLNRTTLTFSSPVAGVARMM